jgi:(2Fe-2S) ferredoxin
MYRHVKNPTGCCDACDCPMLLAAPDGEVYGEV